MIDIYLGSVRSRIPLLHQQQKMNICLVEVSIHIFFGFRISYDIMEFKLLNHSSSMTTKVLLRSHLISVALKNQSYQYQTPLYLKSCYVERYHIEIHVLNNKLLIYSSNHCRMLNFLISEIF